MRKIIVISMISLDGVMQAPGGPEEDTSGGFAFGGWTASFGGEGFDEHFAPLMQSSDLLLGRRTFDIFAGYWPQHAEFWPGINEVTKYVVSRTRTDSEWSNSTFLGGDDIGHKGGDAVRDIHRLKESDGGNLTVWGSGDLIQTLLENDLVDELALVTYPVTLGSGKKLFDRGTLPAAFTVTDGAVTPSGVVFARYIRAGDLVTGNVGPE
ncbi:MAG: dihydrofolate reductase family protein [Actinomycetota bacterium]|nr:dihydrofolate reductase family protein [Actinomycetota bacterium]